MLAEFSLKLAYSTMSQKSFKFVNITFLENALNLDIFTLACPLPTQDSSPSFSHHTLGREKLLIPPGSIFSKICLHQQQKGVEEIQSENMKMT